MYPRDIETFPNLILVFWIVALKENEITERLELSKFRPGYWHLERSCAVAGDGLIEGFGWLVNTIRNPPPLLSPKQTSPKISEP